MKRIEFLDGLRGLAIMAVVLYHAYDRYAPPNSEGLHVFRFGFLGVNLFFLISGFVILLSLERTKNYASFLFLRWRRLFPAMLVATLLIYFSAPWLSERPRGLPQAQDMIPGLTFIDPHYLNVFSANSFSALEGSFWSLFVEVKFYILFGALFFWLERKKAVLVFTALCFVYPLVWAVSPPLAIKLNKLFGMQFMCWFTGGCWMYLFYLEGKLQNVLACILICCAEIVRSTFDIHFKYQWLAQVILLGIFILPFYVEKVRDLISNKFLFFFAFISYPLYLVHENAMMALGIKLNTFFKGSIPQQLLPLIPIGGLILVAYLIARYAEPAIKKLIDRFLIIS